MEGSMFQNELEYFKANQDSLVKAYQGRVLAIKGNEVIGVFNNALDAYFKTIEQHEPGTFMLQPCEPGPEAYTVIISTSELITA